MPQPAERRVVIAGATGLVGETLLQVLAQRGHGAASVHALGSGDAVGQVISWAGGSWRGESTTTFSFGQCDLVFLAVDAAAAAELAARALRAGARVVDSSAAFRADASVPLVVPEVNGHVLDAMGEQRLCASPNCSATMLLLALAPLQRAFGLEHVAVATYQAVSGAGRAGLRELERQARAVVEGTAAQVEVFPVPCAFNVFPHESPIDASLANEEERKIVAETRRILAVPQLPIDAACVRVPVRRAHCQAVTASLATAATLTRVGEVLRAAAGLGVVEGEGPPADALAASGRDEVLVSRVRWATGELDRPEVERRRLQLWLCADQLRKGAALNAVQIAERARWLPPPRR